MKYNSRSKRTFRGDVATLAKACAFIAREQGVTVSPVFRQRGLNAVDTLGLEACVLSATRGVSFARAVDCAWIADRLARIRNLFPRRT